MKFDSYHKKGLLGKMGEAYVFLEFLKLGISGVIVGGHNLKHAPDLLMWNGISVEVKTSLYLEGRFISTGNTSIRKGGWAFAEIKRSNAMILAFVLLNADSSVYKILYSNPSDFHATNWNYRKPPEINLAQGKRGPISKETSIPAFMEESLTEYLQKYLPEIPISE